MSTDELPYIFAVTDHDLLSCKSLNGTHAIVAQKLTDAGYDVGLMLWTASPQVYTGEQIHQFWREALERAGITRFEVGRDEEKQRAWYRVWPRPNPTTGVQG